MSFLKQALTKLKDMGVEVQLFNTSELDDHISLSPHPSLRDDAKADLLLQAHDQLKRLGMRCELRVSGGARLVVWES